MLRNDDGEIGIPQYLSPSRHCCAKNTKVACRAGSLPLSRWTCRLDGKLISAQTWKKCRVSIAPHPSNTVATAAWDGHIFINLSKQPQPFHEYLAGLDAKFTPWGMEKLTRVERKVYHLQANWKLVIQNYSECLHCPIVHPLLNKQSHYMSGDNEPPQPTYLGGRMDLRDGVKTLSMDGQTNRDPLPGLSAQDQRHVYYCLLRSCCSTCIRTTC